MFCVSLKLAEEEKNYYVCDSGEAVQTMPFESVKTLLLNENFRVREWHTCGTGTIIMFENIKPILIETSEYERVNKKPLDYTDPFLHTISISQREYNDLVELYKVQAAEEYENLANIHNGIQAATAKVKTKIIIK